MGAARDELAPGLRVVFHARYAIYHIVFEREVVIVRVLHGSRDILAIARQGGFASTQ